MTSRAPPASPALHHVHVEAVEAFGCLAMASESDWPGFDVFDDVDQGVLQHATASSAVRGSAATAEHGQAGVLERGKLPGEGAPASSVETPPMVKVLRLLPVFFFFFALGRAAPPSRELGDEIAHRLIFCCASSSLVASIESLTSSPEVSRASYL